MDITLLTKEQNLGDAKGDGQLEIMKRYGTKTGISDLAILLGGLVDERETTEDKQRSGSVWSTSPAEYDYVTIVGYDGERFIFDPRKRYCGVRPALPASETYKLRSNVTRSIADVQVVEHGEYPQTIANTKIAKALNVLTEDELKAIETGKIYTFDSVQHEFDSPYKSFEKPFNPKEHAEYEYEGKRYIRVESRPVKRDTKLSNGTVLQAGNPYWIEVKPIEWLVEPDTMKVGDQEVENPNAGLWLARQALFAGVQFHKKDYDGNFKNTDMNQYLQNCFAKEMEVSREHTKSNWQNIMNRNMPQDHYR